MTDIQNSSRTNFAFGILLGCLLVTGNLIAAKRSNAAEPKIAFDVPAMLQAHELIEVGVPPVSPTKIIEVVIPVTSEISPADRDNVKEFRFDLSWNGPAFPIADYGPKSQTVSHIQGTINVDRSDNNNVGFGLNANTDKIEGVTLNANADLSKQTSERSSYKEIPQHHPVIASGTIQRGTGAFFRFHRSRTETLEGGREVVVAWRVKRDWRGGILKVDCRAIGKRKILGAFSEDIDVAKSFIVPICLEGDVAASQIIIDYVAAEQNLRRNWHHRSQPASRSSAEFLLASLNPFPPSSAARIESVPQEWVIQLIESGDDNMLRQFEDQLPQSTAMLAKDFVSLRKSVWELGMQNIHQK